MSDRFYQHIEGLGDEIEFCYMTMEEKTRFKSCMRFLLYLHNQIEERK